MQPWTLLLFSLIVQACVGTVVWMEILQLSSNTNSRVFLSDKVRLSLLKGITLGVVASVLISFMHLGSPTRALFAISNLGTSWLSREILFLILFGVGVGSVTAMFWRGWGSETTRRVVGRVSALLGLALLFAMARLYMLPTIPGWNTATTPISFYTTCLVLGGTVVLASLLCTNVTSPSPDAARTFEERPVRGLALALIVCLGVEIALTPFQAGILYNHPMIVDHGVGYAILNTLLGLRVVSVAVALGLLLSLLFGSRRNPGRWILATTVLVLLAEILGRYTFYAFYYRIGV